jgi:hypothetical protein
MVKKYRIKIITLLCLCFAVFISKAQNPEELVKKDFPKLYNDFKSEVGSQKARYVFAIDISNSMKPYEAAVKANLQNFINALPDGDIISIIQMASMQETRSIVENQPVNASTRKLILSYITGLSFNKVGSDGFTMTSKIIEAMNQTGSSDDMKYVFMFTDFEYWTKENQFNKNAVQWSTIGKKLKGKDGFLKVYGLELFQNGGANIRKDAVYKEELKQIFGKVEYVSGDNSAFLNTWFNNTKANILTDRLQYVLNRKTVKQNATLILKASGLGKDLVIALKEDNMSSVYSTAELESSSLAEIQKTSEKRPWIGSYSPKPVLINIKAKLRSPKYKNEQKSIPTNEYNEVDKLLDPQFEEYEIEVYEGDPYLPWYIGWPLVVLLVFWIGSIIFHLITFRSKRNWYIKAIFEKEKRNDWAWEHEVEADPVYEKDTFTISENSSDCPIPGINSTFEISYKRNVFCIPFLRNMKRGYYLYAQQYDGELKVVVNNKGIDLNGHTTWIGACGNSFKNCVLVITSTSAIDKKKKTITLQ